MVMGQQETYDLSEDIQEHGLYGACWREMNPETLAGGQWIQYNKSSEQFTEDGNVYGSYNLKTGVTLYNKRNSTNRPGCLMRKTRLPIDLSKIGAIEMDLVAKGSTNVAPWYSIWLAPMVYARTDDNAKAAEIDIIENYDQNGRGHDVNDVRSNFAQCGIGGSFSYTDDFCKPSSWGHVATEVQHHISVKATEDPTDGRVIRVHRCKNPDDKNLTTCDSSDFSEIRVEKSIAGTTIEKEDWFRVWNKELAGERYGKYFLVIDMWWTSDTDFKLSADNVKFFFDDGKEWVMDMTVGNPPIAGWTTTIPPASAEEVAV
jgi:hypothetical protein